MHLRPVAYTARFYSRFLFEMNFRDMLYDEQQLRYTRLTSSSLGVLDLDRSDANLLYSCLRDLLNSAIP